MKRKIIQIANSTQLVSLPRKWCKDNNIKKGDEIDVQAESDKVIITAGDNLPVEKAELDVSELGDMTTRCLHALYKRGVDDLKVTYNDPSMIELLQKAVEKDVGFEILSHDDSSCIIKNVSGSLEEFDLVLRRTFLLLMSLADQSLEAIKQKNLNKLKGIVKLEDTNNRFTLFCRRSLNKEGSKNFKKIGPIYYIVEQLENIADRYKFTLGYIYENRNKKKVKDSVLEIYKNLNEMLRLYYELFYKFDAKKLTEMRNKRDAIMKKVQKEVTCKLNDVEIIILNHSMTTAENLFCMLGPYLTLTL